LRSAGNANPAGVLNHGFINGSCNGSIDAFPAMSLINAKNISLKFDQKLILDNVSLSLEKGDFITIIGPNGAGKSTLLKALIGLIKPDTGRVERKPGVRIGYIPQKLSIEASLPITAEGFIRLNKKAASGFDALTDEHSLTPLLGKPVQSLSGGEWQRVLLARALMDSPEALILDEPAQNLDLSGQLAFYKMLDEIHRDRGIAILMVSHDLHMVMASTRQVVCLYHHICCSGAPQAVTKDPEFINLFGHDMASMMAIYHHDHDHDHDHHQSHSHNDESQDIHKGHEGKKQEGQEGGRRQNRQEGRKKHGGQGHG
jgi:zinc transport system ATP-binding protein